MNTNDTHSSGMDRLFAGLTSKPAKPHTKVKADSTPKKNPKRTSFLSRFEPELLEKARIVAVNNSVSISDIINFALANFIDKYEDKHGKVNVAVPKTIASLID